MAVRCGQCCSAFPQETAMIRSRTVNTIHELSAQGKSIQDIAITLGLARNTVRKYLRHPELSSMPHPRPNRRSKLDPFKEQIKQWIKEDHCYNCEAMLPRLLAMGVFVKDIGGQFRINKGAMVASDRDLAKQIWGPVASEKSRPPCVC